MEQGKREACERYVAELFAPEDEILAELRLAIRRAGLPEIQISADEGKLLQVLLQAIGARLVIELGTLGGYSAIWMARALPSDGRLITIEKEADRAELARDFIARAGLAERVEVRVGDALPLLEQLAAEGPFDAAFIDADKAGYPSYLEWCAGNVRSGGLVIADNAFKGGRVLEGDTQDPGVIGIQEFNRRVARDARFTSIVVPTRDGVAIALVN
ncbi:MAG: class I SAM-dependent methyltransferase [Gemmatimonadota bacterium]|nr:MAG: class I SAM-dependent methyltransferase [Gemmatimonadota bacterium]